MDLSLIIRGLLLPNPIIQTIYNNNTSAKTDENEPLLPLEITSHILPLLPAPANISKTRLINRDHKELVEKK